MFSACSKFMVSVLFRCFACSFWHLIDLFCNRYRTSIFRNVII